ncbi:unnamed protein product [Effrenium voratum]|uniref:Enoyl-CoA delta isomerase 1, mitochondrial n=1 Tax=Effrenium voratum TaxID=2562239 RepID=A0AA36ICU3_9DINO|nr:unnamed protein product [Effrenium voratum]
MAAVAVEKLETPKSVAVISFGKEPVNSMDLDFWKQLKAAFEGLEADPAVRGVVFQSTLKKNIFTAGLDIKELHARSTTEARLKEMWLTLTQTLSGIYGSRLATVAAINGACPAGGCVLAMCCDYRIITWEGSMGLNEVALGIPVPRMWCGLMALLCGAHPAQDMLLSASMPGSTDLRQLGLVDEIVEKPGDLMPSALTQLKKWLKFPSQGFVKTKANMRGTFCQRWRDQMEAEAEEVWKAVSDPASVASLDEVLKRLAGAAKPKAKL